MSHLAENKIQKAADPSALGFLAGLRSGQSRSGSGNMFAALLSEMKNALPHVKPADPDSGLRRLSAERAEGEAAARTESAERPAPTVSDNRPDKAEARADRDANETAATRGEGRSRQVERGESQPAAKTEGGNAKGEERGRAESQAAEEARVQESADPAGAEAVSETVTDAEFLNENLDEAALMELLASLNPFADQASVQETAAEVATTTSEKEDVETALNDLIAAETAMLANLRQMGDATVETETVEAKTPKNAAEAAAAPTDLALPVLESTPEEIVQGVEEQKATTTEPGLSDGQEVVGVIGGKKAEKGESSHNAAGAEAHGRRSFDDFFLRRDHVPPAGGLVHAAATERAAPQAAVQELAKASESVASVGAAKSAETPASAVGVRSAGSYDFASQLSAVRATKGGTAGLPEVVEQVAVQLHKQVKEGKDEMTIHLRPAELGKIEVKLEFAADKKVQATVVADNPSTLQLLQKDQDVLQRALQEAGLRADPGSLQFSLRDDRQPGAFAQGQTGPGSRGGAQAGGYGEEDAAGAELSLAALETYYITPGRVNLRV